MKIQRANNFYNKSELPQSFGSVHLYDVKLKSLQTGLPLKASFVKLNQGEDLVTIQEISKLWEETQYGKYIADVFKEDTRSNYYAVMIKNPSRPQSENIASIICTSELNTADNQRKVLEIELIQSTIDKSGKKLVDIKGAGEIAVYGAVRKAKEEGYEKIVLGSQNSENDSFYRRIKFLPMAESDPDFHQFDFTPFRIKGKRIDRFLKRVEKKYGFNSIKNTFDRLFAKKS